MWQEEVGAKATETDGGIGMVSILMERQYFKSCPMKDNFCCLSLACFNVFFVLLLPRPCWRALWENHKNAVSVNSRYMSFFICFGEYLLFTTYSAK